MIKIAYVVSTLNKTGPTNILAGILSHLDRKVYKPYVITLSAEKDLANSWLSELETQKVQIIPLNLPRYRIDKLKRVFQQKIAAINPDIVHAQCFRSALLCANLQEDSKKIATIHCDFPEDFRMAYGKILGKIMAWLYAKALKKMDCLICCSRILADLLAKKFPQMKFDYVNNGVDTRIFHPVADKKTLRKKLGLPLDKTIFVWVGSFIQCKDPLCLVQAIKKANSAEALFIFCGARGPLFETAKNALKEFSNVLFTGYTDKVALYMQASDCYISTSLSEGFHLTAYESLSCGLPVILTKLDVYRGIEKSGCALFFKPAHTEELKNQILSFLRSKTACIPASGVEFIKQGFSCQSMSQKYQEYYKRLTAL